MHQSARTDLSGGRGATHVPTGTFSLAKRALSSASVLSGCSATRFLTRSVCGASANVLWPPNLVGLTLPVSRLRLMNPPTVLKAKLYNSATSSRVSPASIAATAHSRRSSEYGFAIHNWPPCPSGNLESDSRLLGNPFRFDLPGKCSSPVQTVPIKKPKGDSI